MSRNGLGWSAPGTGHRCDRALSHTHPCPPHTPAQCNLPRDTAVSTMHNFSAAQLPNAGADSKEGIRLSSRESLGPLISPLCQIQEPKASIYKKSSPYDRGIHDGKCQKTKKTLWLGIRVIFAGQMDFGMTCKEQQCSLTVPDNENSHRAMQYDH